LRVWDTDRWTCIAAIRLDDRIHAGRWLTSTRLCTGGPAGIDLLRYVPGAPESIPTPH
jgi:hypothetical protein